MSTRHDVHHVVALVLAAGRGVRLGEAKPKAFVPIGDEVLLTVAVKSLLAAGVIDRLIVAAPAEFMTEARALLAAVDLPAIDLVAGGVEREDSVRAGLAAAGAASHILVHDAARAMTPPSLVAAVVAELATGAPAVVPGLPVTDTIKAVDAGNATTAAVTIVTATLQRTRLRAIQTPQGFTADVLREAYALDADTSLPPATDDAGLVERLGVPVRIIPGDRLAFKITTALDLRLARALHADALAQCHHWRAPSAQVPS